MAVNIDIGTLRRLEQNVLRVENLLEADESEEAVLVDLSDFVSEVEALVKTANECVSFIPEEAPRAKVYRGELPAFEVQPSRNDEPTSLEREREVGK